MPSVYGRDLDLNLLRVFAEVAAAGSVTAAAARLYLTQPAVSAALRRLTTTIGAPLFVRQGRGLTLTDRGRRLAATVTAHLPALLDAALTPPAFDPQTSTRVLRIGLSDAAEVWLLPGLVRALARTAPGMKLVALPVQFRTIAGVIDGLDLAVTVADPLPATVRRRPLFHGGFVCLFDPRHVRPRKLTRAAYFAHHHVIVSYNGDLRGIVEDLGPRARSVRCSVASFANLGAMLDGNALVATVPTQVAAQLRATRPHLVTCPVPVPLRGAPLELLWPAARDDDAAGRFARELVIELARGASPTRRPTEAR